MDRIVAIGASEGGVHALRALAARLPREFPAPILIVLHVGPRQSLLPSILNDAGPIPARHVLCETALEPGQIYVAPPDRHLMVVDHAMVPSDGPRENWARPAIDPLFRSAAEVFGPRVIGMVLTGQLNDGARGLYEIKRRGGVAVVQDPADAEAPSMPRNALNNVEVDFCVPLAEMPAPLVRLASGPLAGGGEANARSAHCPDRSGRPGVPWPRPARNPAAPAARGEPEPGPDGANWRFRTSPGPGALHPETGPAMKSASSDAWTV